MNILKNIGAVVAGFLTVVILSVVTDFILDTLGIFPPATKPYASTWEMLLFALIYRTTYTVAGGFVTAKLSPGSPMKNVVVLGVIGTIGGILGVFAGWNLSAHWYPIALAILAFPSVWLGGKIFTSRKKNTKS